MPPSFLTDIKERLQTPWPREGTHPPTRHDSQYPSNAPRALYAPHGGCGAKSSPGGCLARGDEEILGALLEHEDTTPLVRACHATHASLSHGDESP
jgi:hypothetical protein